MKRWTFFTLLIAGVVAARAQPGPGFALGFNGSGNYVAIPHTAAQDSMPMTVTAWVNTSQSTGQQGLVNKYVANSLNGWNVFLLDGHVRAWYFVNNTRFVWDGSNGLDGGFIADGFWHHVAFTVDASGGKLYVDGVVRDSRGWSGAAGQATTTQEVRLGNYPGGSVPFNGLLDEISIWDIALSQVSIQSFMTNSGLASDLLASYRCDEGFGLTVSDSSTVDGTNNGTWVGTAVFVSTTHITINVAWYRLGENDPGAVSGAPVTTTTTDIGRTNHLQQFGGPLYTNNVSVTAAARAGSSLAVQFNGTSQYLSNAIVPLPLDNFCIEAWVKANSVSAGSHIIAYNGDSTANGFGLLRVGGSYLGLLGSLAFVGSVPVTTNVWTHLALVRNNGLSRLYVNGAIASSSNNAGPVFPAGGFALAARPQAPVSEFFDGAIDEVRVFTLDRKSVV